MAEGVEQVEDRLHLRRAHGGGVLVRREPRPQGPILAGRLQHCRRRLKNPRGVRAYGMQPALGVRVGHPGDPLFVVYIYIYMYIYIYIYILFFSISIFFRCLTGFCDGSPPATRRRGGYSETQAGGQPGPTRAAPPAAFGVAARGGGSCGGCGSGGTPTVEARCVPATCVQLAYTVSCIVSEGEKGRGGRGRQGGRRGKKAAGGCSATCVPHARRPGHQGAER